MAEAAAVAAFGASLGVPGGPDPGPGPLPHLTRGLLRSAGRRLRGLRPPPAGPRPWLFLGGSLGLCHSLGLDPSLGVVGAIAGGLPHSPLLPGGLRGVLALLLFTSGLWLLLGLILRLGLRLLLGGSGGVLGRPGGPPPLWMALVRIFGGPHPGLWSFQGVLPPPPLPPLKETVQKAVASLQALGPGGGGEGVPSLARSFLGGPGPQLQRWLRLRAWTLPSYLSELWEEEVHLGGRGPLPTSGNYYLMDIPGPPPSPLPAARAANLVFALLRFRGLIRSGTLPPTFFGGSVPTCSAQYERIFNTNRVPGENRDRLWHGGGGSPVAVLVGGGLYRVPVTRGGVVEGPPLPPRQLQSQFQKVLEEGGGTPNPPPPQNCPGVLTAGERPPWARARGALLAGGGPNAAALRLLDEAPLLVAFDPPPGTPPQIPGTPPQEKKPNSTQPPPAWDPPADGELDAEAKALLMGPPHNRWFDKSLSLIVFPSGRAGLSLEHSWGDPPVVGHLWEYALALDWCELGYEEGGDCKGGEGEPGVPPPQRMDWEIPPEVGGSLGGSLGASGALAQDLELHVCSAQSPPGAPRDPQGLVQIALEIALIRERGPCLTYEALPVSAFREGRGEGLRGVGPHVMQLERALRETGSERGRCRALLGVALGAELEGRRGAWSGAGLERHLQALGGVAKQAKLRPPFLVTVLGQPWAMASSPAPRPHPPLLPPPLHPAGGGFAPPHPDGYGVSYAWGRGGTIIFHISCWGSSPKTDARRFASGIRAVLGELGGLLGAGGGDPPE